MPTDLVDGGLGLHLRRVVCCAPPLQVRIALRAAGLVLVELLGELLALVLELLHLQPQPARIRGLVLGLAQAVLQPKENTWRCKARRNDSRELEVLQRALLLVDVLVAVLEGLDHLLHLRHACSQEGVLLVKGFELRLLDHPRRVQVFLERTVAAVRL